VTHSVTAGPHMTRSPGFRPFFSGAMLSVFGDSLTRSAIPLIVYQQTRSPVSLGITLALTYLPYPLFGLLAGVVVDRYNRWRVLMASNLLQTVVVLGLGALHASGTLRTAHVYVAVFLLTTAAIPEATATPVVMNEVVPRGDLLRVNRWLNGGTAVSEAAGPVVGIVLLAGAGAGTLLLIAAATFLLVVGALSVAHRSARSSSYSALDEKRFAAGPSDSASGTGDAGASPASSSAAAPRNWWRSLRNDLVLGLLAVWRDPVLRAVSTLVVIINLFAPTVQAQFVVYAVETLRLPESASGLLLSAGAVGAVAALPLIARLRRGRGGFAGLLTGSFVVEGIAVVALAVTQSPLPGLLLWMVSSGAATVHKTLLTTLRQHIVDPAVMGRVFAASMVLAWSIIPIGVLAGGFGTKDLGIEWTFIICGAAIIAAALTFHHFSSSRIRSVAEENNL
jgi:Major Facilitator Superfamily